jgi:hypothetical protein
LSADNHFRHILFFDAAKILVLFELRKPIPLSANFILYYLPLSANFNVLKFPLSANFKTVLNPMLWLALQNDEELTAVVRSRQLHIYRNGKKVLVLAGKSAPKILREDPVCEHQQRLQPELKL